MGEMMIGNDRGCGKFDINLQFFASSLLQFIKMCLNVTVFGMQKNRNFLCKSDGWFYLQAHNQFDYQFPAKLKGGRNMVSQAFLYTH